MTAVAEDRARRIGPAEIGYWVLLGACTLLSAAWLVVGAVVAAAAYVPALTVRLAAAAARGDLWARGVLDAVPRSEPLAQAVLDYGFSLLNVAIAVALLASGGRNWSIRLLVLAMIGSAGAFNLQAHAAAATVETATGLGVGALHQVLLHGVACAAYIVAMLVFPSGRDDALPGSRVAHTVVIVAGVSTLLLVGFGTALLPHTVSCVLFFGFGVPLAGLVALPRRIRRGSTAEERTQARLLFSVLVAAVAIVIVLSVITLLLWSIGWTGLTLVDPTAHSTGAGEPTALLFWFSRLACVAIAGAVLVATRRGGLWTAERLFSRGLAAALVAAVVGGGYVVVSTLAGYVIDTATREGSVAVATLATVPAALAFLPLYVLAEGLVDRLLYGTRPTPYSVLAGIAALSRSSTVDAPDLARVAEAVGRGLGATTCRLTVIRPGLRDRTYAWTEPGAHASDSLVEVPVRQGAEQLGTIAVDRAAVAGLHLQRHHLLEDIADSLGAVLQASRMGIELERQLRTALAHAGEIAVSRREAVAEMDGERRRIERDLHDGAQHHLVSLRLTLGLVEHQVSTAQFDEARDRLNQVAERIDGAESILAETATGVSSPRLSEFGLVRALDKELRDGHTQVTVIADGVDPERRFPSDVEAAVYFCCLEAVNNARKHAPGAAIRVRLTIGDGRLRFTVHDEGPGWDTDAGSESAGRGLRNVQVRIAAVRGRIGIRSKSGAGTTVEGWVPLGPPSTEASPPTESRPATQAPPEAPADSTAGAVGAPPVPAGAEAPLLDRVRDAVRAARVLYEGTPHADRLHALAERLDEPVRVAVAGPAGCGVSTLVAALVGGTERVGRTPAGVPVWYRHSDEPLSAVMYARSGEPRPLAPSDPDLPTATDVDRIEVLAPAPVLATMTVIDLPGLGSANQPVEQRARAQLDPAAPDAPLADAYVLLLRHRRPEDVALFTAMHGGPVPHRAAHAIGVLARADELAESAERAAEECGAQPEVRRLCQAVVPVAGLLAAAGTTVSEDDHRSLQRLSECSDAELARLTLSVDAFTAGPEVNGGQPGGGRTATDPHGTAPVVAVATATTESTGRRRELLDRFGLVGVRLAVELIRSGRAPSAAALGAALEEHSGMARLRELVDGRFVCRAGAMKARSALIVLETQVRTHPPPGGSSTLSYQLDQIRSGTHELTEMDLVDALRDGRPNLPDAERRAAEQLLGAEGAEPRTRLALASDAGAREVARAAGEQLAHWQRWASHPGATSDVRKLADVLVQTCERMLSSTEDR